MFCFYASVTIGSAGCIMSLSFVRGFHVCIHVCMLFLQHLWCALVDFRQIFGSISSMGHRLGSGVKRSKSQNDWLFFLCYKVCIDRFRPGLAEVYRLWRLALTRFDVAVAILFLCWR